MKTTSYNPNAGRMAGIAICIISCLYFALCHRLSYRFSTGENSDYYQYLTPFAFQERFLDIHFPLIGHEPPFSESWGIQWPFHMVFKSALFSIFPYSHTTAFIFSSLILLAGSLILFKSILRLTGNILLSLFAGFAALLDQTLLNLSLSGRPEGLTCLLFIILINEVAQLQRGEEKPVRIALLLPFLLLPGVHHMGFMVITGILIIHIVFFNSLFPKASHALRWYPLLSYTLGCGLCVSWFILHPAAMEQMKINLEVQNIIYQSATRFTYFQNFLANPPLLRGYIGYGLPLAFSIFVVIQFTRKVFCGNRNQFLSPDITYASAIVVAMPIIGYLFRVDNFFHFSISSFPAIYIFTSSLTFFRFRRVAPILSIITLYLCASSSAHTLWKFYKFHQAEYPNFSKERASIIASYPVPGRLIIPTDFINELPSKLKKRCFAYTFPMPITPDRRDSYEVRILSEASPGDLLIVHTDPSVLSDRLLKRPMRDFNSLPSEDWEFLGRHVKTLNGRKSDWGWDYSVYRRR